MNPAFDAPDAPAQMTLLDAGIPTVRGDCFQGTWLPPPSFWRECGGYQAARRAIATVSPGAQSARLDPVVMKVTRSAPIGYPDEILRAREEQKNWKEHRADPAFPEASKSLSLTEIITGLQQGMPKGEGETVTCSTPVKW